MTRHGKLLSHKNHSRTGFGPIAFAQTRPAVQGVSLSWDEPDVFFHIFSDDNLLIAFSPTSPSHQPLRCQRASHKGLRLLFRDAWTMDPCKSMAYHDNKRGLRTAFLSHDLRCSSLLFLKRETVRPYSPIEFHLTNP